MFNIKPKSKDERLTILIIEYQDCTIYNSYMKMAAQASKSRKSSFFTPNLTLLILRAFDQLIFKNLIVLHSRYWKIINSFSCADNNWKRNQRRDLG